VISKLACSLVDVTETVQIVPGTLAHRAYGVTGAQESFRCTYGLNPIYRDAIEGGALRVSGVDSEGQVRIVELSDRRFYLATLYLPQLRSTPVSPHPLIVAYLEAARAFRAR
jgi:CTP synthase (UTP-ammonia lyase)